jgi:hypothetical protein
MALMVDIFRAGFNVRNKLIDIREKVLQNKAVTAGITFAFATFLLWYSSQTSNAWRQNFCVDLGSSLYSSLVLIFLYDRVIDNQIQLEKKSEAE